MSPRRYQIIGGGASFSSGGATVNVIPKADGAGGLKDSSLTDNGTTITSAEVLLGPAGAISAPTYSFSGSTNTGTYVTSSSRIHIASVGVDALGLFSSSGIWIGMPSSATLYWVSGTDPTGAVDVGLTRVGAASLRLGGASSATPVANTFTIGESSRGGTDSNVAGAAGTIGPGIGTGTGAASAFFINRNLMGASGSVAQTRANALAVGQSKTLSNTSATAQTIATITLGSNAGGGCSGAFTIVATDGTNFDAETQSFNVSFVNKAGALTIGSVVVTASTAASNSGSATLGITAVANGNNIDIKVTPVFTTIVPTTVTLYPVISHSTNTVTFS